MDENFIPFSMIEPLITPGMTGKELHSSILQKLNLPVARYVLQAVDGTEGLTMRAALPRGLMVVPIDNYTRGRNCNEEPVR